MGTKMLASLDVMGLCARDNERDGIIRQKPTKTFPHQKIPKRRTLSMINDNSF